MCGLAGSLARLVGGYVADRMGEIGLLLAVFPMTAILSGFLCGLFPLVFSLPLIFSTLLFLGFGNRVVFQVVSLRFQGMMGTASGFIGAAGAIGGFLIFGLFSGVAAIHVLVMQRWLRESVETLGNESSD